jgi:energy-coupling factor transporter ATP-binding protein EcfA2
MSEKTSETSAELDALLAFIESPEEENELVALSENLPLWQRDALRRIAQKGELSVEDKETLKTAMYAEHKLDTLNDELAPLMAEHCMIQTVDGMRSAICSIGPVTNVNQLAEGQPPLQFTPNGITLIYGDNGSGKSGYIRIAKKICRARIEDHIHGNAYFEEQGNPSANIRWQLGDDEKQTIDDFDWTPGQTAPNELSTISVFDTKNANLYVDGDNRIEFLPFEVDLFKKVVDLCGEFKTEIDENIVNTEANFVALPEFSPGTNAEIILDRITKARTEDDLPSEEELRKLAEWAEDKEARLIKLKQETAQNSIAQANLRSRCAGANSKIADSIKHLESAFSDEKVKILKQQHDALNAAKIANDLAAEGSFTDLPLEHVGSEVWQIFFKYAKEYATEAYPDNKFPYIGENAKCLLCQQSLDEGAKQRFSRFDNFITGKAAQEFQERKFNLTTAIKALNKTQVPDADDATKMLAEFESLNEENKNVVSALLNFLEAQAKRKDALIEAATLGTFEKIPTAITFSNILRKEVTKLKNEEEELRKNAQSDDVQQKQAQELAELEGRKLFSDNVTNIIRNRTAREKWLRLKKCDASVGTTGLSRKVSTLRERHLTNELNTKIEKEIKQLGLSYLNIKIKDRTTRGESDFQSDIGIKIDGKNSDILSEGEQRGLALACFLAEANVNSPINGIIVDDPVSSLDHQRIELVAQRLVGEAKQGRQVIIFTHNILFYQEIIAQAAENQVGLAKNIIHRNLGEGAGIVEADAVPYQARKVTERINILRSELATMKKSRPPLEGDDYRKAIESFCTELRKTWERLVETVLLNSTVERFAYGVKTQSLKGVHVEDDDHKIVYFAMKALSNFTAHDEAAGKQGALPELKDLESALDELDAYRHKIDARRKALEKERKKLEAPPNAKFV